MTTITLHEGDNRVSLRRLIDQGVRVHSVVCDPPYGLTSIAKRFGKDGSAPAKFGTDGAFARASAGFMGSRWDGTGIERDPEFWRLIWEILLPGGYVVAFSGSRTGHWQACAMEMAGFIMHPLLGWVYGQGFPKAHNAAKAIDKALGVEGELGAPKISAHAGWIDRGSMRGGEGNAGWQREWMQDAAKVEANARQYIPASADAAQWQGWAYGGQALKPALEPIYVGQKPFSEKNGALNLLKHGAGAINIDACRVPAAGRPPIEAEYKSTRNNTYSGRMDGSLAGGSRAVGTADVGRHPANLLHDGSDAVTALFPDSKGQLAAVGPEHGSRETKHCYGDYGPRPDTPPRNDTGSAARFFNSFGYSEVEEVMRLTGCTDAEGRDIVAYLHQHLPVSPERPTFYQGKATKADRAGSKHPTVKPVSLIEWLVTLVTPPGGTVLDPFAGSGTTGQAARNLGFACILMEAEPQFAADIRRRFNLFDNHLPHDILALLGSSPDLAEMLG